VAAALEAGAKVVTSTYNEPLITAEWAAAVFAEARRAGLLTSFVSNGHATPEVLDYLRPLVDAYKVDLKGMREATYREVGGRLAVVLDALAGLVARGFWVEVVTLLVPGRNDSDEELRDAARFLGGALSGPAVARYGVPPRLPDGRRSRNARGVAPSGRGDRARRGPSIRLRGNLPGGVGDAETTVCPGCSERLVERRGFRVVALRIGPDGRCPRCGRCTPGIWSPGGRIAPETPGAASVAPTGPSRV
jgi:Pyruvate-formate lyase-activating enzyme